MLKTINKLNSESQLNSLITVARKFLPNPGIEELKELDYPQKVLAQKVLEEIRKQLNLGSEDNTIQAYSKIYNLLTAEMQERIISKKDIPAIESRLGQKGLLNPSEYIIEFTEQLKKETLKRGVNPEYIRQTVSDPYSKQHLSPGQEMGKDTLYLSLFTRDFDGPRKNDRYTLLVFSFRKGNKQSIMEAFQIFHSDIKLSVSASPLDILISFVNVYGMRFNIGTIPATHKFLLYEALLLSSDSPKTQLLYCHNPLKHSLVMHSMIRMSPLYVAEVAFAFVIDTTLYTSDLLKHGVEIRK